jgi:hypothetical protein
VIYLSKIADAEPKNSSGGYERLFGNKQLGNLITKTQSACISMGSELEKTITDLVRNDGRLIGDIDIFLEKQLRDNRSYLASKKVFKKSKMFNIGGGEPDFIVFRSDKENSHCHIIELKDGYLFDTSKSQIEKNNLIKLKNYISDTMAYDVSIHICCFNQKDKEQIKSGLKGKFVIDEIMTGKELCRLLKISYYSILKQRKKDAEENFTYFVSEVAQICDGIINKNN